MKRLKFFWLMRPIKRFGNKFQSLNLSQNDITLIGLQWLATFYDAWYLSVSFMSWYFICLPTWFTNWHVILDRIKDKSFTDQSAIDIFLSLALSSLF